MKAEGEVKGLRVLVWVCVFCLFARAFAELVQVVGVLMLGQPS